MTANKPQHLPPVGSVWGDPLQPLRWWIVWDHTKRSAIVARWANHDIERMGVVQFWEMVEHYGYQQIDNGKDR